VLSVLNLGFEQLDTLRDPFRTGNQIVTASVDTKFLREMTIGPRDGSCFDLHVDSPQVFASTLGFALLPVETGTRLGNNVYLVDIARLGVNVVDTALCEQRHVHVFFSRALRPRIEFEVIS
jgi:hypothetical protein